MRIAAITMVQGGAAFLPLWIARPSAQFEPENLFVIDHGSGDGGTDGIGASGRSRPSLGRVGPAWLPAERS